MYIFSRFSAVTLLSLQGHGRYLLSLPHSGITGLGSLHLISSCRLTSQKGCHMPVCPECHERARLTHKARVSHASCRRWQDVMIKIHHPITAPGPSCSNIRRQENLHAYIQPNEHKWQGMYRPRPQTNEPVEHTILALQQTLAIMAFLSFVKHQSQFEQDFTLEKLILKAATTATPPPCLLKTLPPSTPP